MGEPVAKKHKKSVKSVEQAPEVEATSSAAEAVVPAEPTVESQPAPATEPASGSEAAGSAPAQDVAAPEAPAPARGQEPSADPDSRPAQQPWFGNDRGGLGIAGAARRPGAPGTHVLPEVRSTKVQRAAAPRPVVTTPAPAAPQRTVRHVGSTSRGGLVAPAMQAAPTYTPPATPTATRAVSNTVRTAPASASAPAPAPRAQPEPAPTEGARPVVRVSLSQAAAAGNQTLRPLSPTLRTTVATVARPAAAAQAPKEKPRREVDPAEPLPIPAEDAVYFAVRGLGTPACARRVERAVRAVAGVEEVDANLATGLVAVAPKSIDRAAVEAALAAAGHPAREGAPGAEAARQLARRQGIAAAATLAVALASHIAFRSTASALAGTLIAAASLATAWPVVEQALRQLVRLRPSAELLPLAATLAALAAAWTAGGHSPALAALPLVAHLTLSALANLASARAVRVIDRLRAALPDGDGARAGSRVEVEAGALLPADGRLVHTAIFDESAIGGDDDVERLTGESVSAGAIATHGATIDVVADAARSRVARGLRVAERALATRPTGTPAQVASLFIAPVALVAAVAAAILQGPWVAAAVLAGAAPLALGLASALASAAGVTRAAARGVAVRSSAALERAARTQVVLFDKTFTLTRGDAAVLDFLVKAGRDPREVLAAAAAVESGVDHGIARALVLHAVDLRVSVPQAKEREIVPGLGVRARVDGRMVAVGSAPFVLQSGVDLGLLMQPVAELAGRGRTPLVVTIDDEAVAVLGIAETPRESARQAMGSLELLEVDLRIASGDAHAAVQWLTEAIGLDKRLGRGDLSSAAKKELVEELRGIGPCLVVGASPLDALALSAADLGVAAGTDPALEAAAGALLVRHDPQGVVELIHAGRATRRGRRLATVAGIGGNAAAMGLAATGAVGVGGAVVLAFVASLLALGAAASPWLRVR